MSKNAFVIIAPNSMAYRAIVNSAVLPELQKRLKNDAKGEQIIVLSPDNGTQDLLPEYVVWRDFLSPSKQFTRLPLHKKILRGMSVRLNGVLGYGNLAYRFNQKCGFYAHQFKKAMSKTRRERETLAGNFVSKKYGFPFTGSVLIYRLIYRFFYSKKQICDPSIQALFNEFDVSRLVFWHVQNEIFRDYCVIARQKNIPIVGVLGSWDRPTTKGPLCPGCEKFIVNSQVMRQELMQYHQVDEKLIEVVGWPQMDVYLDKSKYLTRASFIKSLPDSQNINANTRLLLFAGNSARLGAHEPSIVAHMQRQIAKGVYGDNVHIVLRPHPNDVDWQQRYAQLSKESNVCVLPAQMGDVDNLINCLLHASIVLATAGSISLDAVGLDRCVINIGFDGDLTCNESESVKQWYRMDHYKPVIESEGVSLVESFAELDEKIVLFLAEPDSNAMQRETLRTMELAPFEGDSSLRQVNAMI